MYCGMILLKKAMIVVYEPFLRWTFVVKSDGVGEKKKPIVKQLSNHVYCGVSLGGLGVATGASVGRDLATLVDQ